MKTFLSAFGTVALIAVALAMMSINEVQANHGQQNVVVQFRSRPVQVQVGRHGAYVSNQLLVDPRFRGNLNQLNSFGGYHTPTNSAANIRYVRSNYYYQAPQQIVYADPGYTQTQQVVEKVVVQEQVAAPPVQYQQQAPEKVVERVVERVVVQPQRAYAATACPSNVQYSTQGYSSGPLLVQGGYGYTRQTPLLIVNNNHHNYHHRGVAAVQVGRNGRVFVRVR